MLIVIGETGSGKTTQLPQFLLDAGCLGDRVCAVTQPRRVAAQTVAARVAQERGVSLGTEVGYCVRFDDRSSPDTRLRFMTDGVLVRECLSDPELRRYAVVMLDEAHDRSLHTDILFGLVRLACERRPDLRVLVASATLDADKFSAYFGCPVVRVPGRTFPVDIYHSKLRQVMTASGPASSGYVQAAADVVMRLHRHREGGDQDEGHVLVFLTGREDIERACALIRAAAEEETCLLRPRELRPLSVRDDSSELLFSEVLYLVVLPLYGALSSEEQQRVFESYSRRFIDRSGRIVRVRKVIVATNIAETSITVPHVRFVVDAGYVKQKVFDPVRRIESLVTVPISKGCFS